MIKHRYYSALQYEIMKKIDPLAAIRNERMERESRYQCLNCGSVDVFIYVTKTKHNITFQNSGLIVKPIELGGRLNKNLDLDKIIDSEREKGRYFNPTCGRCGGTAMEREAIIEHCENTGCLGCMFCGRAAPLVEVEIKVGNCIACMGGDRSCESNCPNEYMRKYYGIFDTNPSLLKAPENYEERQTNLSR